jgi:hypothetical protein
MNDALCPLLSLNAQADPRGEWWYAQLQPGKSPEAHHFKDLAKRWSDDPLAKAQAAMNTLILVGTPRFVRIWASIVRLASSLVFIFLHLHSDTGPQAIIYIIRRSYADQSQLQVMIMAATGLLPYLLSDATPFRVWCSAHLLATTGLGARRAPPLGLLACPPAATWRFPFYKPDPRWPATLDDPREACQLLALGAALTSADTVRQFAVKERGAPVVPLPAEKA